MLGDVVILFSSFTTTLEGSGLCWDALILGGLSLFTLGTLLDLFVGLSGFKSFLVHLEPVFNFIDYHLPDWLTSYFLRQI